MRTQTAQTITPGQVKELGGALLEGVPLGLLSARAQALIGNKERLHKLEELFLTLPEGLNIEELREMVASYLPFGDEELTDSTFLYKEGFPRLTWAQRLGIIQENFPGLNTEGTLGMPKFIEILRDRGVDEWVDDLGNPFIIPDWRAVADTYAEATVLAWNKVAESKPYKGRATNYREGTLTEEHLRLVDDEFYRQLENEWGCQLRGIPTVTAHDWLRKLRPFPEMNVWPVFAQTGLRHRTRSVRRSHVCFSKTEWGGGPFEMLCVLLTDGEYRMTAYEHLGMDAAGALYNPGGADEFNVALCSRFDDDGFYLDDYRVSYSTQEFGSFSASLQ